ncbi:MOSC domain-containing protein [Micromonospora mirobrigensis]|uniref:MOSC domain-containing protein n=1 Tax=Micromonospora mirobrigensis TaxID=262898 RepID=A0A1C4YUJ3_9ACTN|nr:MOSC N-terminal beta barrel domain-containing protein [Micromonospora mirobrigensis]SCF24415.1 hypothetical protein GA0070564_104402 [Micromonospora mirobrigensis]
MAQAGAVGHVEEIWRYPVKSMLGERRTSVEVTAAGIPGDRRLALRHQTSGKIASAKDPRRWRSLLTLRAEGDGRSTVRVTLPDGRTVAGDATDVDDLLSAALGEPVTLIDQVPPEATLDRARPEEVLAAGVTATVAVDESRIGAAAPPGSFVDFAPIHLVNTPSLARAGWATAGSGAAIDGRRASPGTEPARRDGGAVARYRPNLVLATDTEPFAENGWVGRELRIGTDLVLRVIAPTPRCAVPTLAHGDLPPDPDALRVPARLNRVEPLPGLGPQPCLGAYAQVLRPGPIRVGDQVRLV